MLPHYVVFAAVVLVVFVYRRRLPRWTRDKQLPSLEFRSMMGGLVALFNPHFWELDASLTLGRPCDSQAESQEWEEGYLAGLGFAQIKS